MAENTPSNFLAPDEQEAMDMICQDLERVIAFDHLRRGSGVPCEFRLARRNGELVFRAGYQWHEGNASGVEWKDIPIVDLDEEASDD